MRERVLRVRGACVRERVLRVRRAYMRQRVLRLRGACARERVLRVRGVYVRERVLRVRGACVFTHLRVCVAGRGAAGLLSIAERGKWFSVALSMWLFP